MMSFPVCFVYNTGMILDIIIIVIFFLSAVRGKQRGFGDTFLRLLALVSGIVLGTLFTEDVSKWIRVTPLDEWIEKRLTVLMQGDEINLLDFVPGVIGKTLRQIGVGSVAIDIRHFTNILILVVSFLIIVFACSAVCVFLRRRLYHARTEGTVIGTMDSTVGFLFGMIRGALLVFLFLAFLFPLAGIFLPDQIPAIHENLQSSYIAGYLYNVNPLILFIRQLSL